MDPANVLVLAEAGSHMYGVSTPTSDTDYIIVYRQPTKVHAIDHVPMMSLHVLITHQWLLEICQNFHGECK